MKYHACKPVEDKSKEEPTNTRIEAKDESKLKKINQCIKCTITFETLLDMEWHLETEHVTEVPEVINFNDTSRNELQIDEDALLKPENMEHKLLGNKCEMQEHSNNFTCQECGNSFPDLKTVEEHAQAIHRKPCFTEPFPCQVCGLVFNNFALLQVHVEHFHQSVTQECSYCESSFDSIDTLRSHMCEAHEEVVILHTMAQQVDQITDHATELGTFKQNVSNILKLVLENQNSMKQELFLIRNNHVANTKFKASQVPLEPAPPSSPKNVKNRDDSDTTEGNNKELFASKVKNLPKEAPPKEDDISNSSNILIVGDSHLNNLDGRILREASFDIDRAIAYTVDADKEARYPERNFLKTVPERMSRKKYKTLILQGGCNEISNVQLNPGQAVNIANAEEKVKLSRTRMFELAKSSLKNYPHLEKVVIVKSLPRYDPSNIDPNSIKQKLNQYGNSVYDTLWVQNGCPSNITIVDLHLECQGPLREKRFGNPGSVGYDKKRCDMIHLRGRLGAQHYTNSFVRILSEISPSFKNRTSKDFHRTCTQTKRQTPKSRKDSDGYQYQRGSRGGNRQDSYYYRQGFTQEEERDRYYDEYNVEVSNRFSNLGN